MATDRDLASWIRRQLARNEWNAADLSRRLASPQGASASGCLASGGLTESCRRLADVFNVDPDMSSPSSATACQTNRFPG